MRLVRTTDALLSLPLLRRIFETREAALEAAISLAHVIARKSPIAVQGSKINLNYARDHTIEDNFTFMVGRPWMTRLLQKSLMSSVGNSRVRGIVVWCLVRTSWKVWWPRPCRKTKATKTVAMKWNSKMFNRRTNKDSFSLLVCFSSRSSGSAELRRNLQVSLQCLP